MKKSILMFMVMFGAAFSSAYEIKSPRLIVYISIDQLRADHLIRYAREYDAGFKRLLEEGIVFTNATLNYSGSATGPGHATLGTGVYPWKSGIVSNTYTDRVSGRKTYCVEDSSAMPVEGEGGYRSPGNLLVTGFGDWLTKASVESKVISLSYKDRAAILMSGKKARGAYWYNRSTGHMTTSTYYMNVLPEWVRAFNASSWIENHLQTQWTKLKMDTVYAAYGPDDVQGEGLWDGKRIFPYSFTPAKKADQIFDSPFGNDMLLDFARAAIKGEQLGSRGVADLLCISLSSTDNIGSEFGPNSHEMIDNLLRIDRGLGSFIQELETSVGRENILVVLSADHGVMPLPEYTVNFGKKIARRLDNSKEISRVLQKIDSSLCAEHRLIGRIVKTGTLNYSELDRAGVNIAAVEENIRQALMEVDGVADVYFRTELLDERTPQRPYLDAYRHSFLLERSPDFFIRTAENCLITADSEGTSHGSPYLYDTQVPIIFWGQKLSPHRTDRLVHSVDITATMAAYLRIKSAENLDGIPLEEVHNP